MNTQTILNALKSKEILSEEQAFIIESSEIDKPFSIHWELRSILYLGIILFSSGIGIIIYENIDTIGHQAIIALIALLTGTCFYYTFKNSLPYSNFEVKNPNKFVDHVLLLGCTLLLALEGYLQFQYNLFGSRYGLAIIIPTILFFGCAYRFDHRGALSMAVTGLASWLGLTIAPLSILSGNDFTEARLLITAIILGLALVAFGWISEAKSIKKHFSFTYIFMGANLAAIATLTGLIAQSPKVAYFLAGLALSAFLIYRSRYAQSLIFLLMGVIYGYIIITYTIFSNLGDEAAFGLASFYFLFSSLGVIFFLLNFKKFLGIKK